jgi:hypothetical protein
VRFSFGYAMDERVRAAILALPERAWRPAINVDGQPREGAWVAELTGEVSLDAWPEGSRLIVRRERPHPGAQLSFTDIDGHRFQCFITDQGDRDLAAGGPPPRPRDRRGPRPRAQEHRPLQPALLGVSPQTKRGWKPRCARTI